MLINKAVLIPSGEMQVIAEGIISIANIIKRMELTVLFMNAPQTPIRIIIASDKKLLIKAFSFALDHEMKLHISYTRANTQKIEIIIVTKIFMINTSVIKNMSHLVSFSFKIEQVVGGSIYLYGHTLLYFQSEAAETVYLFRIVCQ